ncbi:MAG TPA: TatD family hydrolase [Bryobacteraceae bacterium]|nr:TatD family hydrolase [Bryobacteraceae bacterium]
MSLIDSHCHLDSPEFDADRDAVIERALEAGVDHMMAIGTGSGPPDLEAGLRLAEKYPAFYATVGIHPHDAAKSGDADLRRLAELLAHPKVLAVGEIGLDYHYDFSPRDTQRAIFIEQMAIAAAAKKPIVIHTREAWDDTLALIEEHWKPHGLGGIMHCFSGSPAEAERAVGLGFYLSFGGIATFPKAVEVRAAAQSTPRDRILVETDAPYLAPVPKRGKRNEPALIVHTAQKLAEVRGESYEDLCRITTENFRRLLLD